MNYQEVEAHLEVHDELLKKVESLVPKSVTNCYKRECTLDSVSYEEGGFVARYSVYVGCGDYEEEELHFSAWDLFKEEPSSAALQSGISRQIAAHDASATTGDAGSTPSSN